MRRFVFAVAVAALGIAVQPASAAVNTAVAGPGAFQAGYATPRLVLTSSAPATFVNLDIQEHDIRSVAVNASNKPLFKSNVIGLGENAPITGLNSTPAGEYAFYCTIHPSTMRGVATVA